MSKNYYRVSFLSNSQHNINPISVTQIVKELLSCFLFKQFTTGTVDIRKEAVRQITEKYGMSRSAIFNALHKLCDADILKKGEESGTYHINPLVFWKGNAWDRTKALRLYMQL